MNRSENPSSMFHRSLRRGKSAIDHLVKPPNRSWSSVRRRGDPSLVSRETVSAIRDSVEALKLPIILSTDDTVYEIVHKRKYRKGSNSTTVFVGPHNIHIIDRLGKETENFYVGTYYQETLDGDVVIEDTLMHGDDHVRLLDMGAPLSSLRFSRRLASEAEGKRLLERLRRD